MALAIAAALLFLGLGILEDLFRPINPVVPILYGLLSAILASGLIQMERAGRLRVPQALVFLGDASYSLYLIHYMALSAGAKVLFQLWLRRPFPLPVVFVVLLCIALGAGIGLHLALERVLLKLLPRKLSANA
jgi:peptidoglycan/LPS O-acetylase OafA/YrhL